MMEPEKEPYELIIELKGSNNKDLYDISEKRLYWITDAECWTDEELVIFTGSKAECLNFLSENMDLLLRGTDQCKPTT